MSKKFEPYDINKEDIVHGSGDGYFYCVVPESHPYGERRKDRKKRYLYLHRARMENKLGRYLLPNEQVDHKDGNKARNNIGNLELTTRGPHQKHHAENGNSFWKKSPMNKPGRSKAASSEVLYRIIHGFLNG